MRSQNGRSELLWRQVRHDVPGAHAQHRHLVLAVEFERVLELVARDLRQQLVDDQRPRLAIAHRLADVAVHLRGEIRDEVALGERQSGELAQQVPAGGQGGVVPHHARRAAFAGGHAIAHEHVDLAVVQLEHVVLAHLGQELQPLLAPGTWADPSASALPRLAAVSCVRTTLPVSPSTGTSSPASITGAHSRKSIMSAPRRVCVYW
jgi:hypothetical protein